MPKSKKKKKISKLNFFAGSIVALSVVYILRSFLRGEYKQPEREMRQPANTQSRVENLIDEIRRRIPEDKSKAEAELEKIKEGKAMDKREAEMAKAEAEAMDKREAEMAKAEAEARAKWEAEMAKAEAEARAKAEAEWEAELE